MAEGQLHQEKIYVMDFTPAAGAFLITAVIQVTGERGTELMDKGISGFYANSAGVFLEDVLGAVNTEPRVHFAAQPDKYCPVIGLEC